MLIPSWARLALYISMAVVPIWIDFFKISTDYTFRGLMMPLLSSLLAAITVTLARTQGRNEQPPKQ